MNKTELKQLLRTVEAVRSEIHPELAPEFLEAVLTAERENFDDEVEAVRAIKKALQRLEGSED